MARPSNKEKILIVDDNKQNIEILMNLFKSEYRITAAISAERALKIARSDAPPDIILLDILMPDMDGYEVCRRLKEDEKTRDIPIIFVTAVSEVMDAAKGFNLGAVDYIAKPFHPPIVMARVRLHLDLKHKRELLEEYAFIDALTEIPNRRSFDHQALQEWNRARRSGQPLSLLLLDIDHFKEYNDTYGHGQGDQCLIRVAQTIQESLRRAGDLAARYGGEEFAALLPYTDQEEGCDIAWQILKNIEALGFAHQRSPVGDHVTISCGLATALAEDDVTLEQLIEEADQALYKAKRNGRNRVECFISGRHHPPDPEP
ncbi:MAG: diguanylate cyclase [Proteobacteria bacterium]|nr:diguanylate cyclase [Pseudomonadota bacterium]